jgi:Rrf2 family transcriptional regulator, cysteine metabolism repressor
MIVSTKARYGVRAMYVLAENVAVGKPISIKYIAGVQKISEQYLEQIFSKLKKAQLVRSIRGQKGGYVLNKRPDEISIGQVIRSLEGPLAPVNCVHDESCCDKIDSCCANAMWTSIYNDVNKVVDSYFISDMLKENNDD